MEDPKNTDLELAKCKWTNVIAYEKSWLKTHANAIIPMQKILEYFGVQTICELYGCTVATELIAKELIIEAFK